MAQDGLSIKLIGAASLDRKLTKMRQRVGTKIVNQALNKGAAEVRKEIKKSAPQEKGELRKSIKNRISRKTKSRYIFMATVFFKFQRNKGANDGSGGWYSMFLINRHNENAFGNRGGRDFVKPATKKAEPRVRKIIGDQLAIKIAKELQKDIDNG